MKTEDFVRRERELLEERARLIGEYIRSQPELVAQIQEGLAAAERGEGIPAKEYFAKWRKRRGKSTSSRPHDDSSTPVPTKKGKSSKS